MPPKPIATVGAAVPATPTPTVGVPATPTPTVGVPATPTPTVGVAVPASTQIQTKDFLGDPAQWPRSLPTPVAATRVLTYVFAEKDNSKVEEFLKYIKEKAPSAKVFVVKDELGFISVSITQLGGGKPVPVPVEVVVEEPVPDQTLDASASIVG